ncbi:hypothetical protein EII37_03190 [Streptococcus sp. OH4692_COT-348]|nr:hypothetical protein EII37_03190 [Streptococcus sp. OH4692_COT-348]
MIYCLLGWFNKFKIFLYSMKIKEQIRKLATDCSKHCFEVVNKTDGVSNIYLRQGKADVI